MALMEIFSQELIGAIMIGVMLFAIFIGFPISFTLIFLGLVFGYWGFGKLVFYLMTLQFNMIMTCLLYTSPSPRDVEESRMPSSA